MQGRVVEVRQFVERRKRAKSPYGEWFMMLSQKGVGEIAERLADRTVTMVPLRVLMAALCHMDYENRVDAAPKDLAFEVGITQSDLSRACGILVECGFLERMRNRRGWYRVSPRLCWKGSVKNLEAALAERVDE